MNSDQPIGVFDSGVGGLTVVRELQALLPDEDIIYFGDTKRTPYGSRSAEEILTFMREILDYMLKNRVKLVVVACNTMTVLGLDKYRNRYPFSFVGMNPGAEAALAATRNQRIAVLATQATIASGKHASYIRGINPRAEVFGQPCPLLVPLIEKGYLEGPNMDAVLDEYLGNIKAYNADSVILGCTHYPFIVKKIKSKLGSNVNIINPAYETARDVKILLHNCGLINVSHRTKYHLGFSDNIEQAKRLAGLIIDVAAADFELIHLQDFQD